MSLCLITCALFILFRVKVCKLRSAMVSFWVCRSSLSLSSINWVSVFFKFSYSLIGINSACKTAEIFYPLIPKVVLERFTCSPVTFFTSPNIFTIDFELKSGCLIELSTSY